MVDKTPKFLRNTKTGVIFPYKPHLAAKKDMRPIYDDEPKETEIEVGGQPLSKAKKGDLLDFMEEHNVAIPEDDKVGNLREAVKVAHKQGQLETPEE